MKRSMLIAVAVMMSVAVFNTGCVAAACCRGACRKGNKEACGQKADAKPACAAETTSESAK